MGKTFEGLLTGDGLRVAIAVARFNELIAAKLLGGALDALRRHGVAEGSIDVAWAPGSFELPLVCAKLAGSGRYDAVIALGAVIRGGTPHFEYVAAEAAKGVAAASLKSGVPVIFGVLTTNTIEEAIERAGTKHGNKGADAAAAAIEMAHLMRALDAES